MLEKVKIDYCLESWTVHPRSPLGASNVRNLDTTGKPVEDDRHVPNAVKRPLTMQRKIAWKKFDVQTANKIIRLTQELAFHLNYFVLVNSTREMFPSWKLGELWTSIWEKAATPPLHGGRIEPMTTPNIEHLRRNCLSWKPMLTNRTYILNCVLMLNWIIWNWTVFDTETVLTLNWIVIYNCLNSLK